MNCACIPLSHAVTQHDLHWLAGSECKPGMNTECSEESPVKKKTKKNKRQSYEGPDAVKTAAHSDV